MHAEPLSVVKIGGSVLTGPPAYRRAAAFIADRLSDHPGERLVVVVSAQEGHTDALLSEARDFCLEPDRAALDLLWSTGELRSVALLTLALHALGVRAAGLNVHQTGLDCEPGAATFDMRPLRIRAALASSDVVVAPGFLARGSGDGVVSLGRGGSDLTAVLLAAGLGARRCELAKDVAGYFTADPHERSDARHLPAISFEDALRFADEGCGLVQRQAIEAARAHRLPLVIRAIGTALRTHVGSPDTLAVSPPLARTA